VAEEGHVVGLRLTAFQGLSAAVFGFGVPVAARGGVVELQVAGQEQGHRLHRAHLLDQGHRVVDVAEAVDHVGIVPHAFLGERSGVHHLPGQGDGRGIPTFVPQGLGAVALGQPAARRDGGDAFARLPGFGAQWPGLRRADFRRHGAKRFGERVPAQYALRVQRHHFPRQLQALTVVLEVELFAHHDVAPAQKALVRRHVAGTALLTAEAGDIQRHAQGHGHVARDLLLHREHVVQLAPVGL